jgi:hypothetical protein
VVSLRLVGQVSVWTTDLNPPGDEYVDLQILGVRDLLGTTIYIFSGYHRLGAKIKWTACSIGIL